MYSCACASVSTYTWSCTHVVMYCIHEHICSCRVMCIILLCTLDSWTEFGYVLWASVPSLVICYGSWSRVCSALWPVRRIIELRAESTIFIKNLAAFFNPLSHSPLCTPSSHGPKTDLLYKDRADLPEGVPWHYVHPQTDHVTFRPTPYVHPTFHPLWQFTIVTIWPLKILLLWQIDPMTIYYCDNLTT